MKNQSDKMQEDWERLNSSVASFNIQKKKTRQARLTFISAAAVLLLMVSSSVILIKNNNFTTIKAPTNHELTYTLPDGSSVVLSNGSKIRFAKSFDHGQRYLDLKGEAFFDVVSNANDPFIVNTGETKVQVTGTTFKVSAIKNSDEVAVEVKSGKVLFYNSSTMTPDSFRVGLGPGELGIYLPKLKQLNKTQALSIP